MSIKVDLDDEDLMFEHLPEVREQTRTVDLWLSHNGEFDTFRDIEVSVLQETANASVLGIQNRIYSVRRQEGDKLFFTRPKFDTGEAFMLPLMLAYAVFSTFLNIQLYFNPENFITFSNMILLLLNFGSMGMWAMDRQKTTKQILMLKQYLRNYETIDLFSQSHRIFERQYVSYKGFSIRSIFGAFCAGIVLSLPFALSPVAYSIDYIVSFVAGLLFILVAIQQIGADVDDSEFHHRPPKIYGMGVVEGQFYKKEDHGIRNINNNGDDSDEDNIQLVRQKGYKDVGVLVPFNKKADETMEEAKQRIENKVGNYILTGVDPVYHTDNSLDTPERSFQTLLSEVYHDIEDEGSFEINDSEQIRRILELTKDELNYIEDIREDRDVDDKLLDDLDQERKEQLEELSVTIPRQSTATIRNYLYYYESFVRLLYNSLVWLSQENKTRTEVASADKNTIEIQRSVIASQSASGTSVPVHKEPINWEKYLKYGLGMVAIVIIFFLVLWLSTPTSTTGY